jgi:hypothetical protein
MDYSLTKSLTFCIAYFNPMGYRKIESNLIEVLSYLTHANQHFIVGEVNKDKTFDKNFGSGRWICTKSIGPLFYKEAIWNWIGSLAAVETDVIVFLDGDVILEPLYGFSELVNNALLQFDIIQPFSKVIYLDNNKIKLSERIGAGFAFVNGFANPGDPRLYHLGFGFAMRSSTFREIDGFFPCIIGEGDVLSFASVLNYFDFVEPRLKEISVSYWQYYLNWLARHPQWQQLKLGFIEGEAKHLHHGSLKNRQYDSRLHLLAGLVPELHLTYSCDNKIPSFNLNSPAGITYQKKMISYFKSRRDDDV